MKHRASLMLSWILGSLGSVALAAELYPVTAPPAEMKLDAFYEKYTSAGGYPVVASGKVNDYALKESAYLIDLMLAKRPDLRKAMVANGSRMVVIGSTEFTTDIPEYNWLKPKLYWDKRARGLGGSETDPVCSCAEENMLAFEGDPYSTENIMIHEFAHNIHLRGLKSIDPKFDEKLKACYDQALAKGLWKGTYAGSNDREYFAEGVQSWFDNNRENDGIHNHVNTRAELEAYDPGLAAILKEIFGDTELRYTKPQTRLKGHLAGFDPSKSPKFAWPAHLLKAVEEPKE